MAERDQERNQRAGLWRGMPLDKRYVVACLVLWMALVPICAWVAGQDSFGWKAVSGPLNALTGAFAAVVIGAVIVQKWQKRIEDEKAHAEATAWLHRNLDYAIDAQVAMRDTLGDVASISYAAVTDAEVIDIAVPGKWIHRDVESLPEPSPELQDWLGVVVALLSHLDDERRQRRSGPLGLARQQVSQLSKGLAARIHDDWVEVQARVFGNELDTSAATKLYDGERRVTDDEAASLLASFDSAVLQRLEHLAERVLSLTSDMVGMVDFEPNELRRHAVALLVAAQHITTAVEHARGDDAGTIVEDALALANSIGHMLRAVSELRCAIWSSTRSLFDEADKVGEQAAFVVAFARMNPMSQFMAAEWEMWRLQNGLAVPAEGHPTTI
jgi:hypothetical protein